MSADQKTKRFTLEPQRWYAMMLLGDEFGADEMCTVSPSPIRIESVRPLKTGTGLFELKFFHANYPEGVQDKTYTLRTIHRGGNTLLAQTDHDPPRFMYLTDLTTVWLRHNFPHWEFSDGSAQDVMNREYRIR